MCLSDKLHYMKLDLLTCGP